jgi:hypothetical protein
LHCAGVFQCMMSMAAGRVPSGEATLAGAPPATRHWPPGQPHVAEHCRPHRTCSDRRGDPTSSQPTSNDYIDKSPTAPRARTTATRAPAAATEQPSPSSPIRRFSKPGDPPSTFPRTHRSYPGHPLFSPAPILIGVRASAAAPPLLCSRRSPVTSGRSTATNQERVRPISTPCHLFACAGPTSPAATSPPPSGPRV